MYYSEPVALKVDLVENADADLFAERESTRDYQVTVDDYQLCRLYVESLGQSRSQIVSANVASARCNVANVASRRCYRCSICLNVM